MSNGCKVDFINKVIRITKKFSKAAQNYGTEEFSIMVWLQEKLPSFVIMVQETPRHPNQIWNPSYSSMIDYIIVATNGNPEALDEADTVIKLAKESGEGYNLVRRWFMAKYGDSYVRNMGDCEVA